MQNKVGVIKNPLSVIAIFAGIAEISGTMVLPHIEPSNQELYIWFLMIFPFTLVVLFFITLNWNYKVLYAPSDFEDEDNFVNLQKASTSELLFKFEEDLIQEEVSDSEACSNERVEKEDLSIDLAKATDVANNSETKLSMGLISTREERLQQSEILKNINRQRMREGRLLENILLNKVQEDFNAIVERDMKIESNNRKLMFDGVIKNGNNLTVVEVRRLNKNTLNGSYWHRLIDNYRQFYQGLSESEKKDFSLLFVVATDDNPDEIKSFLDHRLATLEFNYSTKIYAVDELVRGNLQNAS